MQTLESIFESEMDQKRLNKSVHEKLNELKLEEINKKRFKNVNKRKVPTLKLFKSRVYFFFVHPTGIFGFLYRLFTFSIIIGSITIGGMSTIQTYYSFSFRILFYFELFAISYFGIEFLLRFWSSSQNPKYAGLNGKLRYLSRPLILLELFVIVANSVLIYFFYKFNLVNYSHIHSAIRLFQILRFLYTDRDAQTWNMLFKVVIKHKSELLTSVYFAFLILLLSAYLVLLFEKPYSEANDDNQFLSFSDCLYWAIITMTTIGFGDRAPRTFYGKLISTSLCIIGMAFWTLPGGIIGSGFALQVEKRNKKKQFNRLVPSAATLIQSWWRMKSALLLTPSKASCLIATVTTFDVSKPLTNRIRNSPVRNNFPFNSFNSRCSKNEQNFNEDESNGILLKDDSGRRSSILMQLSTEHLIAIRTILLMKYFSAMNQFKSAYKPYDFREDLIEQYTRGNLDIMIKLKELQKKIEQPERTSVSIAKYFNETSENSLIESKLAKIENQINDLSIKLNQILNASPSKNE